jgi:hypothetical protein
MGMDTLFLIAAACGKKYPFLNFAAFCSFSGMKLITGQCHVRG